MVEMSPEEGDIRPEEQTMIRRLFSFSDTTVREIMVPLVDVVSVERGMTCGEVKRLAAASKHKRLPVHEGRVDKMVGIVDTMEFLGVDPDLPVEKFMKEPDYVPVTKPIQSLLTDMRREGNVLSVVVDEFGGAEGVVTIEDILEEVVDELYDEYDSNEKPVQWIRKTGERDYHVSARVELDTLRELGLALPDGQYASLAGFLLEKARDIPAAGTVIEFQDITFTIERATPQAIQEVRIRW